MHAHPSPTGRRAGHGPIAVLFQRSGDAYARAHRLPSRQAVVLRSVVTCRTARAGGHLNVCENCGHSEEGYNSCGDRHCPTCQWSRQQEWISARMQRMLPAPHFHVVFTIPSELRPLAAFNPKIVYGCLIKAAAATLQTLAADRHGLRLGITTVLHTWTREMLRHPHVHCIVSAGGLSLERGGWQAIDSPFLFPVEVIKALFRGKFLAMLKAADKRESLEVPDDQPLRALLAPLYLRGWVVYAKAALSRRRHLVRYLGAYTHRVGISKSRIVTLGDGDVTFRIRDGRTATVDDDEFIRRFLLHVLPKGFRKIRHYGLYAPGNAALLDAVGNGLMDSLDDLPEGTNESTAVSTGRGRLCSICQEGLLIFASILPSGAKFLDSS